MGSPDATMAAVMASLDLRQLLRVRGLTVARLPEQQAKLLVNDGPDVDDACVFALVALGDTVASPVAMVQGTVFGVEQLAELVARVTGLMINQPPEVSAAFFGAYGRELYQLTHECGPECAEQAHGTPPPSEPEPSRPQGADVPADRDAPSVAEQRLTEAMGLDVDGRPA